MEESAALSTFHKRNKILTLICLLFIVCLTVVIAALIIYLVRYENSTSALESFCFVAFNISSCIKTFDPIISTKSVSDPNQIFTLSLEEAVKELENVISLLQSNTAPIRDGNETVAKFKNCSTSLADSLTQIRDALGKMRASPLVEAQSEGQWAEMMNEIRAAEENLRSCIDDLTTVEETPDVSEVRAKVVGVKAYVNGGGDFLLGFAEVLQMFGSDNGSVDWGTINLENLFGICVGGLELCFLFFMFWSLCTTR